MKSGLAILLVSFVVNLGSGWAEVSSVEEIYLSVTKPCGLEEGMTIEERVSDCEAKNSTERLNDLSLVEALEQQEWSLIASDGTGGSFFRDDRSKVIWSPLQMAARFSVATGYCGSKLAGEYAVAAMLDGAWEIPSKAVIVTSKTNGLANVLKTPDESFLWIANEENPINYTALVLPPNGHAFLLPGRSPYESTPFRCVLLRP